MNGPNVVTDQQLEAAMVDAVNTDDVLLDAPVANFFDKDGKPLFAPLATYLISRRHVKTTTGKKREMYVYADGLYVLGEDVLKKDIRNLYGALCTNKHINEVIERIKDLTSIDRAAFVEPAYLVNLNNGILDIHTGEFLPHDPQYLFFTKIPIDYKAEADCPRIRKFLKEILQEDQVPVIEEWFGYSLYREYFLKKALILVGEGDTGKSTLLNLLYAFVGEKNVSGVSLQRLSHDKFAAAHFYHKHINVYDDLSSKDIEDNGAFKMATGGGVISGEKKFGDQFVFKNTAKLTFACNKIPDVKDATDDAYFNRWIVIPFSRIIEEENKDRQLIHKLTTPDELSGLLNIALAALKRLLANQRFSYEKDTNEIKTEMMRSASSIARFADDCMEEVTGEWVSKEDMYHAYTSHASRNRMPAVSIKMFGSRLPMCAPYIADFKPKDPTDPTGKKQVTAWRNVKLRNVGPENYDQDPFTEIEQRSPDPIS